MHLLHGEIGRSMALHPFALLLALEGAVLWAVVGMKAHRGTPIELPKRLEWWALGHAAALFALWLGRLASGTAPL